MITLALETSTTRGSVAVLDGATAVFRESFTAERSHGSMLFASLERAFATVPALSTAGQTRIVVGLGPGSYSGVRIAISAAIGLSLAAGAETIGIPSIAAAVAVDADTDADVAAAGEYLAIGDARRGTFYFSQIRHGEIVAGPMLLTREELDARLAVFSGGADTAGEIDGDSTGDRKGALPVYASEPLPVPGVSLAFPDAGKLARLAIAGVSIRARGNLEPIYLRDPHITQPRKR